MSVRETRTVCEDKDGFIWTASKSGISRITNGDYRHYNLPVEASETLYESFALWSLADSITVVDTL